MRSIVLPEGAPTGHPERVRCALLVVVFALLAFGAPAHADLYRVDTVERQGDVVRVYVSADLAPVYAVVRERAQEAIAQAAPDLLRPRDLGAYRLRDPQIEVRGIRVERGRSDQEVRITIDAGFTAEREDRAIEFRGYLPTFVYRARGRVHVATGRLVLAVQLVVADGRAVVLRVIGDRLVVSDPLDLDLDLEGRLLHTHVQPIPDDPSLAGLVPEAAGLRSIDGDTLRFVVRFRRTG